MNVMESILKNPEKVCRINDFLAGRGAYYTTNTSFLDLEVYIWQKARMLNGKNHGGTNI